MTDITAPESPATGSATAGNGKFRAVRWIGFLAILAGAVMIVAGGVVWGVVTTQLRAEEITVSEDAAFLGGSQVAGPFTALAQADIINVHTLEMTGGKTYAELEQNDPIRAVAMNASFLRASLFTSVVSYGVAAFAMGAGLMIGLLGWALTAVTPRRNA
ncbi:aromatic ring-opening dioxygenase LigA [Lysinibacter sp. HNR]|uniref:aromatic ring-opening dioxygenase LigA n=1 Tax=Lysinibacter sp. HNR TaxID=3031408 RepID=UPI002434A615|nr:aromatic ring-opening dioxygenase LigA [Lysinibacter sp. HNR]WGD37844.1 aromatic ring-opening dioxygenase LigA [Lysinibacter sp. HNR]